MRGTPDTKQLFDVEFPFWLKGTGNFSWTCAVISSEKILQNLTLATWALVTLLITTLRFRKLAKVFNSSFDVYIIEMQARVHLNSVGRLSLGARDFPPFAGIHAVKAVVDEGPRVLFRSRPLTCRTQPVHDGVLPATPGLTTVGADK